jgi:hypothetical protein
MPADRKRLASPPSDRRQGFVMRGKIFTRQEADRMIPLIRRIVIGARARHRLILRKQDAVVGLGSASGLTASGGTPGQEKTQILRDRLLGATRRLRQELKTCIGELEDLGCFLRDAEAGVVACYGECPRSIRDRCDDEIVYFIWLPGQPGFSSWHQLDQTYVNRQPLPGVDLPTVRKMAD